MLSVMIEELDDYLKIQEKTLDPTFKGCTITTLDIILYDSP